MRSWSIYVKKEEKYFQMSSANLRVLDTQYKFSGVFTKRGNFCDFKFAPLYTHRLKPTGDPFCSLNSIYHPWVNWMPFRRFHYLDIKQFHWLQDKMFLHPITNHILRSKLLRLTCKYGVLFLWQLYFHPISIYTCDLIY